MGRYTSLVNQLTIRVDFSGINIFSHSFVVRHRCKKPFSSHIIHIVSIQFNNYCDSLTHNRCHFGTLYCMSSPQPPTENRAAHIGRIEKIIALAEKNRVGWETGITGIF